MNVKFSDDVVAIVQELADYEKTIEELQFVKAVAQGLADAREGNVLSVADAKKNLGIE